MKSIKTLLGSSLLALSLVATHVPAAEQTKPIHFGDITWESGSLITEILRLIVEKGYGYPTDTLPGSTVSLEAALAKNDIQVIGEEWAGLRPAHSSPLTCMSLLGHGASGLRVLAGKVEVGYP